MRDKAGIACILIGVGLAGTGIGFVDYVPVWSFLGNVLLRDASFGGVNVPYRWIVAAAGLLILYGLYRVFTLAD